MRNLLSFWQGKQPPNVRQPYSEILRQQRNEVLEKNERRSSLPPSSALGQQYGRRSRCCSLKKFGSLHFAACFSEMDRSLDVGSNQTGEPIFRVILPSEDGFSSRKPRSTSCATVSKGLALQRKNSAFTCKGDAKRSRYGTD
jgi:hypothetical protein